MPQEDSKYRPVVTNSGGIKSDINLRAAFDDRLGQAVAKMSDNERVGFTQRVERARSESSFHEDTNIRTFDRQRSNEELKIHRKQNDLMMQTGQGNVPPPPRLTNAEIQTLAHDTTQERVDAGQQRLDEDVRRDLNAYLENMTDMEDVIPDSFKATEHLDVLDQALAPYQELQLQEHEMEEEQ